MKSQKGFSLIELLIVVAIILIIAAIAIPSLMRARIASNESAMTADIRTFISAEATFQGVTSGYGDTSCLYPDPTACHLGAGTSPMVDMVMGEPSRDKSGYDRDFQNNGIAVTAGTNLIGGVWDGFCYGGTPVTFGRSGNRSFSGDDTGTLVYVTGAACCVGGANNLAACETLGS